MERIRSGNVGLKKVAPTKDPVNKGGGVMAEMAKLLVSDKIVLSDTHHEAPFVCRC